MDTLKDRLSRDDEITVSVTGRKSGRTISNPVWFVWDDDKLYLLPVKGSDTQWYKNVLKNPAIHIDARGRKGEGPSHSHHRREWSEVCGREIPRQVRRRRREEVLLEVRCRGFGTDAMIPLTLSLTSHPSSRNPALYTKAARPWISPAHKRSNRQNLISPDGRWFFRSRDKPVAQCALALR